MKLKIEESVGKDQNAMKLFTKIMPRFKHYISTRFGISTRYYRGEENLLVGTSQGDKFSSNKCRDISCLIIRKIEKKNLGIQYKSI